MKFQCSNTCANYRYPKLHCGPQIKVLGWP